MPARPTASLSALLVIALLPSLAGANDIVDFLRNIRNATDPARQQQLRQQQIQRYRQIPAPPRGRQLPDLVVPGLSEGFYETTLPGGGVYQFHVPPQDVRFRDPNQGRLANVFARLSAEVDAMYGPLQSYVAAAKSTNQNDIRRSAGEMEEDIDKMIRQIERENFNNAVREFRSYSRERERVDAGMRRYQLGPRLQRQVQLLDTHERRIEQILAAGPGATPPVRPTPGGPVLPGPVAPFDLPRVLGLAQQWAGIARDLEQAFASNARSWQTRALQRKASRVRATADSMSSSILDGADYDHVVREFRELDDTWGKLVEMANEYGGFGPQLTQAARKVSTIDHALHEALYIESPLVDNEQLIEPLLNDVARMATQLDRELDRLAFGTGSRNSYWQLRTAAAQLSQQTAQAAYEVRSGQPIYRLRDRADQINATWTRVEDAAERVRNDPAASYAVALVDQMEVDMQRLARIAAGEFGWRYQID